MATTGVLTVESISSSLQRQANRQVNRQVNRQANQNATTGVLTGASIHQQRGSDRNSLCRVRALCPRLSRRKKLGIGPCSGRCPETPVKRPIRASLDSQGIGVLITMTKTKQSSLHLALRKRRLIPLGASLNTGWGRRCVVDNDRSYADWRSFQRRFF